jgi:3-(3-hydroxy-phenyl)propionate hydroxylase
MERVFRSATIALAKQFPFARALINTGRMAVANAYTRTHVCAAQGGFSAQNVPLKFDAAGQQHGTLNDLLIWCEGRLLLLVFGRIPAMDLPRLCQLTTQFPVRVVQVLGASGKSFAQPTAVEHVFDPQDHLRLATQAQGQRWALLRPDSYVVGTGTGGPRWRSQVTAMLTIALGGQP